VSKDYVGSDSGLEYIGTDRQQMGDGGFIAQFTDTTTGDVIATTSSAWKGLALFRAPLNADCASSTDPDTTCTHEILPEPDGWTLTSFDDTTWVAASEYTAEEVGAKDGYDTVAWSPDAELIWSGDLKVDNTILWRTTVAQPGHPRRRLRGRRRESCCWIAPNGLERTITAEQLKPRSFGLPQRVTPGRP